MLDILYYLPDTFLKSITISFFFFLNVLFFSEIILCKPNPCRHGGKCLIIDSRQFSCDCDQTGYVGAHCERGEVNPPDFPKLVSGNPSGTLELQAKPAESLIINLHPSINITIQPEELIIRHPSSRATFQLIGHNSGLGTVSYSLQGTDKQDFTVPEESFIFIGRKVSSEESIYTRLGLLVGELPAGCQKQELTNFKACDIRLLVESNSTKLNGTNVESGSVHIITSHNKTIPLSLIGYNFSSSHFSREKIMGRLIELTKVNDPMQKVDQQPRTPECSDNQLTAGDLTELIQKDALPDSFLRYFSEQLPMWLTVRVRADNELFDVENTFAHLIQSNEAHLVRPTCRFPHNEQSVVVLYRPLVRYSISVENNHLSLSSKDSCFTSDICESGEFMTLSQNASKKVATMQFMQDMAGRGWEFLISSFGFTTPRRYIKIVGNVPDGHLAENFSDFHYNWWWQGRANINLGSDSGISVNMKISGEVFAFSEDLDAVSLNLHP